MKVTKQDYPCPNCGNLEDWYQVGAYPRYRCPGCFHTIAAPKPPKEKSIPAPKPPKGKAKGKAAGGRGK